MEMKGEACLTWWTFLPVKSAGCWKKIVLFLDKLVLNGKDLKFWIKGKIRNGENISFWKDIWFGSVPLMDRWPGLYSKEVMRNCVVRDRIKLDANTGMVLNEDWRIETTSVETISEMQDVQNLLSKMSFSGAKDKWVWEADSGGVFSVASVKSLLNMGRNMQKNNEMRWVSWVPIKWWPSVEGWPSFNEVKR
ncbi:RNA-directed DNA polymerase, eukaryota, Reverse transcriptase zinc-binding domain protein [Artemisia annua]|uniref:RNA-directed DNA polymerase, eukaryota, Reverse transcriptase zinc-binding domain protein n=1 Tax=Artemisia annua TaxID=35608 RepID=A0A2U1L9F7_ARTAN|nr:RNA-directed DNA polymerase, eukaryota, Reverse transcriptase zinc-binding domain protein [Artemisia annua]